MGKVTAIKNKGRYILEMTNMYRPFTSCSTIAPLNKQGTRV